MLGSWLPLRGSRRELAALSGAAFVLAACHGTIQDDVPADGYGAAPGAGAASGSTAGSSGTSGSSGASGSSGRQGSGGSSSGGNSGSSGGSAGTSAGSSGSSSAGSSGSSAGTSATTDPSLFGACPDGEPEPGVSPLAKLTTVQYRNTVRDLLVGSGLDAVVGEVMGPLGSVPDDSTQLSFRGLDKRIAGEHVNAYFDVAVAVGDAATKTSQRLAALAGDCATQSSLASSCLDAFLSDFGTRALRRPLTDAELAEYRDVAEGDSPKAASPAEAIRNVVVSLLMAPRFVNHLELDGKDLAGKDAYIALDPYEVASRLSYTFWQSLPDAELFAAADDGSLATDAGYAAQLERIFDDPRTQQTVWQFWNEWLRFEAFTGFSAERPAFQALAAGEHLGESGHDHWGDMVTEIRDLTELYTWKQPGTLLDLMTSTVSVTRSSDLAHLYGVKAWSGSGDYPELPAGTRQGLLTRSALLATSLETTNPFHRGALIRRAILCEDLEPPDPNSLPKGSLDPPPVDEALTTRERYQKKVEGNTLCNGCHKYFSNIGYTLEAYDSLGRFRSEEKVYDEETGKLLATLPIDTVASVQLGDEPASDVGDPLELNERILASGKVEACLSANYFRYALRRDPTPDSADACAFEKMRAGLEAPGTGLRDVFRMIAGEPGFRRRKVGAP
jgi:hypothetical protein